ncbi:MAG TPA: DUF3857 domain-containing protein [Cytophagaceae bacterium]|jgi:hypothetical protein|nr:DUF3857 domain-containing protein [Cytophagaceae bacterium]
MKKILTFLPFLFLLFCNFSHGIDLKYAQYDWEKSPMLHSLSPSEKLLEEIVLKEKQAIEYIYDKQGSLLQYDMFHKITRVNSNEAIEKNNRLYIPSASKTDFVIQKARVITSSGKIIELQEKDIKEAVEEESKINYRFFALDGLDLGSEIEYFYILKKNLRYNGTREVFQSSIPKKNIEFEIISPKNLVFKVKCYNNLPEMQLDTTEKEKRVLFLKIDFLPELAHEDYSAFKTSLQQLIFKLDNNTSNNSKDIVSYGFISERIYKGIMAPAEKGTLKNLKKVIGNINLKFSKDEEDKIRTIEQYVKANYVFLENANEAFSDLNIVLEKKIATEEGAVKLFCAIFNELGIDYQIVLTCDRHSLKFDPEFETYLFLNDYLIYFPAEKKYLAPFDRFSCLGYVPYNLTNNYGLFIKKVSLDSYTTAIGKVAFIPPVPYDKTTDNLTITVSFEPEIVRPSISMIREMTGYYAQHFQPFYSYFSEEDKKKNTDKILKNFIPGIEIKQIKVENEGKDYFGVLPFIIKSTFTSDNVVEKAGNKYLFKIGDLIGVQMEMYQKGERKLGIENEYNRSYHRVINFEIPTGYTITNLNSLNMDVYSEENGERIIAFTSKYELIANKVVVTIDEYYKKINYPVSQYENYRKVINAAADFNKIILFLEKK